METAKLNCIMVHAGSYKPGGWGFKGSWACCDQKGRNAMGCVEAKLNALSILNNSKEELAVSIEDEMVSKDEKSGKNLRINLKLS